MVNVWRKKEDGWKRDDKILTREILKFEITGEIPEGRHIYDFNSYKREKWATSNTVK